MKVIGIDPSLRNCACVAVDGKALAAKIVVGSSKVLPGTFGDYARSVAIYDRVRDFLEAEGKGSYAVAVEGGAYGRADPRSLQIGIVHAAVYRAIAETCPGLPVISVPPKTWQIEMFGFGAFGKSEIKQRVCWEFKLDKKLKQDVIDAFSIARFGILYFSGKSRHNSGVIQYLVNKENRFEVFE